MNFRTLSRYLAVASVTAVSWFSAREAQACGGLFCSVAQPVNQAAERIIFVNNGDGTVTAVIQIQYQGPSESFSWLLPISTVPRDDGDIGIASDIAFQRLQTATNPQYSLTTRVEGTCKSSSPNLSASQPTAAPGGAGGRSSVDASPGSPVTVEASGVIGSFEWAVISLDQSLADPAGAAKVWLEANGYDVSPGAERLIAPYLKDGLYLLALKLKKTADTGSIRPIVLTYEASRPMIPIKLTAVAANDDMGVMTWVVGEHRSVPQNYLSLELNEARINWFSANATYNMVVTEAADEAGGRGFVTEYANESKNLANVVWTPADEQRWSSFRTGTYSDFRAIFDAAFNSYGTFSGFWDAAQATVTLPDTLSFEDFKACPNCYSASVTLSPSAFMAELEKQVIEPIRGVQTLLQSQPWVTRLYSTLSAPEMTDDPVFTFNPDLPALSNLHQAERVIECNPQVEQFQANWRVVLPQGSIVRGTGAQAQQGQWPTANQQPPNARVLLAADSGPGVVVLDNRTEIDTLLSNNNETIKTGSTDSSGGCALVASSRKSNAALGSLALFAAALASARRVHSQRNAKRRA